MWNLDLQVHYKAKVASPTSLLTLSTHIINRTRAFQSPNILVWMSF